MSTPNSDTGDDDHGKAKKSTPLVRDSAETEELREAAQSGDSEQVGRLFERYRDRLQFMVSLRLDRRLRGRVDTADVLQEAYLEALKSFTDYDSERFPSFYLWLRRVTARKLRHFHRFHLGARARDVRREVDFRRPDYVHATSEALAAQLLGKFTSPSEAAIRSERQLKLQEALNSMSATDREIIALRHFEQLSGAEAAEVLGIDKSAATKRHVRAMLKLKAILGTIT